MHDYSKDVRLPVQLQRAMAAEAEAAREARAKVISNFSILAFQQFIQKDRLSMLRYNQYFDFYR